MSFEPEIDEDLFDEDILDEECDCGDECICEDYEFDEDALDEEELEDLDEEWEEE